MATFTPFGLVELRDLLKQSKGWFEADASTIPANTGEVVLDFWPGSFKAAGRNIVIRVYTRIDPNTGQVRTCGADAIRVCAVDLDHNKGYIKARRVHRVKGWRDNMTNRIMDVVQAALDRCAREASTTTVAPAPLKPAHPTIPADCKTKKSKLAWLRDQCSADDAVALAVVQTIFNFQTVYEQDAGTTVEDNGVGFSGIDAELLTSFVQQFEARHGLSPKQLVLLRAKAAKYAKQYLTVTGKFDAASIFAVQEVAR